MELSLRGTCDKTEDATEETRRKIIGGKLYVREALALDQRATIEEELDTNRMAVITFQRHLGWIRGCNLLTRKMKNFTLWFQRHLRWIRGCNCCTKEIPLSMLRDAQYMLLPKLPNLALTRGLHPLPNRYFSRQPQMSGRRQSF